MRGARALILMAMGAALAVAAGAQTPLPRQPLPQLTLPQTNVQLTAPTRREGAFSVGGMDWRCNGLVCSSQSVAAPSVTACRALMAEAGQVVSYARARGVDGGGSGGVQSCDVAKSHARAARRSECGARRQHAGAELCRRRDERAGRSRRRSGDSRNK